MISILAKSVINKQFIQPQQAAHHKHDEVFLLTINEDQEEIKPCDRWLRYLFFLVADDTASTTVTLQVRTFLFTVAVIVASPALFAVTLPFDETVATVLLSEVQVTFFVVPVMVSVFVSSTLRLKVLLLIFIVAAWAVVVGRDITVNEAVIMLTANTKVINIFLNCFIESSLMNRDE